MTRSTKVKLVDPKLKNRCRVEEAKNIRELLNALYGNASVTYTKTKDDHRYHQGYLQAIGDILDTIEIP
jgi:transcription initiation factor IIE alpha subunit